MVSGTLSIIAGCPGATGAGGGVRVDANGDSNANDSTNDDANDNGMVVMRAFAGADTCQPCHWPATFYGNQLVTVDHYYPDESNTPHQIRMLLSAGGSDPSTGPHSGIHDHMPRALAIEYIAGDTAVAE